MERTTLICLFISMLEGREKRSEIIIKIRGNDLEKGEVVRFRNEVVIFVIVVDIVYGKLYKTICKIYSKDNCTKDYAKSPIYTNSSKTSHQ